MTRSGSFSFAIAVFVCFLVSGLSGLIYEVVWTRLLLTVFGASIYAVSTVLAAFMGGLALGSFLGGKFADRWERRLFAYGVLEMGIAVSALSAPSILHAFEPIYQAVYRADSASYLHLSLLRFAFSFVTLLIPTTCMGATLPLLARFLVDRDDTAGSRIGGLYAVNTTGAVIGTLLAGFVLLARFGVQQTTWIAAALSMAAGLIALALSWRMGEWAIVRETRQTSPSRRAPVGTRIGASRNPLAGLSDHPGFFRFILATYAVAGFVALAFQVFWTRTILFQFQHLGNTTYAFSAVLTVFLVGLALGSSLMASVVDRRADPIRWYGVLQVLTGLAGVYSLYLLTSGSLWGNSSGPPAPQAPPTWPGALARMFLQTAITIGPATFLMGMAFPVIARIAVAQQSTVGTTTGRLYAVNTVGAILGSFAAGFVMIPLVGLSRGLLVLGIVSVLNGSLVLLLNPLQRRTSRFGWGFASLALIGVLGAGLGGSYRFLPAFASAMPKFVTSIIAYREGPLATVTVADDAYAQRRIFVDGVFVAGTDLAFLTDQKSLAHAPMLLLEDPTSALTVGFGSGGASYSFLLYDELERVDCVEICETVPQMAHLLKDSNHGVLDEWTEGPFSGRKFHNGRYQVLLDDARTYLRFTDASYDVIATDCTDLRYKSNANLYDVEYFTLCRQRLTDDGMVVVWFPLAELNDELFACAMKTFAHVFPHMSIWYMHNVPTHYLLLIGTKNDQPLKINVGRLLERIKRPAIQQDLKEVWLHQPEKLLACYVASAPDLIADWDAVTANLNTEDFPHIEFDAPKRFVPPQSIFAHLNGLYRRHRSVADLLEDADQHPEFLKRLEQFEKAALPILEGHFYYRNPEILAARECYRRAMRIAPEDESLAALLTFPELRRIVAHDPDDRAAVGTLAVIEWLDGNFDRAKAMFQRIADPSVSGQAGSASSSGDFDTLGQALEFCYQSSKDPFFRLLRNQIERQVRSASNPG